MSVQGIDEITFGASDLATCRRFFLDWGLRYVSETVDELVFETLNGGRVIIAHSAKAGLPRGIESDPTLREVVWGVASQADLDACRARMKGQPGFVDNGVRAGCQDPNGMSVRVQVTRKRKLDLACAKTNTWADRPRLTRLARPMTGPRLSK